MKKKGDFIDFHIEFFFGDSIVQVENPRILYRIFLFFSFFFTSVILKNSPRKVWSHSVTTVPQTVEQKSSTNVGEYSVSENIEVN